MREDITALLLRDFGLKPHKEALYKLKSSDLSEEDSGVVDKLIENYGYSKCLESVFPKWFIEDATSAEDTIPFRGFITQPAYTICGFSIDYIDGFDGTLPIGSIKLICAELN